MRKWIKIYNFYKRKKIRLYRSQYLISKNVVIPILKNIVQYPILKNAKSAHNILENLY